MTTIFNIISLIVASFSLGIILQTCRKYHVRSLPDTLNYLNSLLESKGLQQLETDVINFQ